MNSSIVRKVIIFLSFIIFHEVQSQDVSPIKISVSSIERTADLMRAYVVIANPTTQPVSFSISSIITDDKGDRYPMEEWSESMIMKAPANFGFTTMTVNGASQVELNLPAGGETYSPTLLRLPFRIKENINPKIFDLYSEGPRLDLSSVPNLPLLTPPKINVEEFPGLEISIGKVMCARESNLSTTSGTEILTSTLQTIKSKLKSKITFKMLTEFNISNGDVWLLIPITWKNKKKTAVEIRIEDQIIKPNVHFEGTNSFAPVGLEQDGIVLLGSPVSKSILIAKGGTASAIMIFRPELWMEEFTLLGKSQK